MKKNTGLETGAGATTARADGPEERRLRSLAANMVFGLALVDRDMKVLRFNSRFKSFTGGTAGAGALLCDGLQRDCSVPDGCGTCPVTRCFKDALSFEREFARHDASGQERYYRLVASPARAASESSKGKTRPSALADAGEAEPDGLPEPGAGETAEAVIPAGASTIEAVKKKAAKEPELVLVLVEDITRKRVIEQKLLRAQRLEAMSTLAGGIAHEINQPLSALNLYASGLKMLLDKNDAPPRELLKERIELILEQARKISEITQHMRSMAIQSATVHEAVNVRAVLGEALENFAGRCEAAGIRLEAHIPADLPRARAVGVQLAQVVNNLLENAVHAVAEAGEDKIIRVAAQFDESRVIVEVADSGQGIPPGRERRIFDPFYTTKGPSEGMGLGLSIIHAFVSSWGGEVQVRARHPQLGGALFGVAMKVSGNRE